MASKAKRGKLGETKVTKVLERIIDDHVVLNDVTFLNETSGMSHQIDHILIHPHGLFVIETKNYFGTITCDEDGYGWFKTVRGRREKIANPLKQNRSHAITLRKVIKSKCPVVPVVVFVQNNAPYTPDENVINLEDLLLFIDSYPYERLLTKSQMKEIETLIKATSVDLSKKEHLENIGYLKQYQREYRAQVTYALEKGKCPECDAPTILDGDYIRCSKCGFYVKL